MRALYSSFWVSFFVILTIMLNGCATYHRLPLDRSTVAERLLPPSMEAVRTEAKSIKHPILKPIDFDVRDGLSPDEAAILAVLANPTLRAVRDQRGVAAAQLLQAGILPNPQLSYTMDIPIGGSTQGAVNAFGLGLSWDIAALVSRGAKIDAARARAASVDLDVAWQEWQVAQAAKLHLFRLLYLRRQLAVAREAKEALAQNLVAVKRAVDIGERTERDLASAEAALQRAHLSVLTLEGEREQQRFALNQALGLPPNGTVPLQGNAALPSWPTIPSMKEVEGELEDRRLDLIALKMGYESQEALVRAAIRSQFPRINIGFSNARDTENVQTVGFGITIDLPFFNRNQGKIAVERATRRQMFDEYTARLFEARSKVASLLAEMDSTKHKIGATEASLPALRRLAGVYHEAADTGDVDVLMYYNVMKEVTSKHMELIKLEKQLAELGIALEIASGRYFPSCTASVSEVPARGNHGETPK